MTGPKHVAGLPSWLGPRTDPHPVDFVPKHCAGGRCTHAHPGDVACECGKAVLPEGVEVQVLSVRSVFTGSGTTPFIRHSRNFCGKVAAPATSAAEKVAAAIRVAR